MAGDWIKFELSTPDKPEVWAIAQECGIDPDAVVGKLLRIWGWFDQQTENGNAPSVSKSLLDRMVGVTGFCDVVINAGWLADDGAVLSVVNFDRHNGKTAKNRALTAKRVSKHRNADVTHDALAREEKRREEKNIKPPKSPKGDWPRFDEFWSAYPRKTDKAKAIKAWNKIKPDDSLVNLILNAVRSQSRTDQWTRDDGQYIPHPTTWLNGKRWDDVVEPGKPSQGANVKPFPGVGQ